MSKEEIVNFKAEDSMLERTHNMFKAVGLPTNDSILMAAFAYYLAVYHEWDLEIAYLKGLKKKIGETNGED